MGAMAAYSGGSDTIDLTQDSPTRSKPRPSQNKENLLPTPVTIDKRPAAASPGSSPAKKHRAEGRVFAPAAAMVSPLPGDAVAR